MKIVENMSNIWAGVGERIRASVNYVAGGDVEDPLIGRDISGAMPFLDLEQYSDRSSLPQGNLVIPVQYDLTVKKGLPVKIDLGFHVENLPEGVAYEIMMRPELSQQCGLYLRGGPILINPAQTDNWEVVVMYDGGGNPPHAMAVSDESIQWMGDTSTLEDKYRITRGSCPFLAILRPIVTLTLGETKPLLVGESVDEIPVPAEPSGSPLRGLGDVPGKA
jgi:hypothetical protein